jgi:PAP2 superfamily
MSQISRFSFAKSTALVLVFLVVATMSRAQVRDSTATNTSGHLSNSVHPRLRPRDFAFPAGLVAYGALALKSEELTEFDNSVKEEVWTDLKHKPFHIDNYAQYAPGMSVFALRAAGIHGRHDLRSEVALYLLSNAVMAMIVNPVKYATHVRRPDGFGRNAFPSGHTATAFAGAEFLHQEYGRQSSWYSIAGYSVATGVGFMRVYNNRHWMRDVVAGAGIGILSTRLAYLVWPKVDHLLFHHQSPAPVF